MKMKSFAILATSALLAAAYGVPAMAADDLAMNGQEMQNMMMADNSGTARAAQCLAIQNILPTQMPAPSPAILLPNTNPSTS